MDSEQISNPESGSPATANSPPIADGLGAILSNPELMAKLPQVMAMLKPMLGEGASTPEPRKGTPEENRNALLLALKPFLSKDRQHAVDAILRIAKLGNVLRQL